MLDEASTNLPHPLNPVESACCIHRMAVIHWSNVGPDLGGTDAGGRRGEIGAGLVAAGRPYWKGYLKARIGLVPHRCLSRDIID